MKINPFMVNYLLQSKFEHNYIVQYVPFKMHPKLLHNSIYKLTDDSHTSLSGHSLLFPHKQ